MATHANLPEKSGTSAHQPIQGHEQAMQQAIDKLLADMSPQAMEKMFTEFAKPFLFRRKSDFWAMYKQYFQYQIEHNHWQIQFKSYYQDALNQSGDPLAALQSQQRTRDTYHG